MNGYGIGKNDLVQFGIVIGHRQTIKGYGNLLILRSNIGYPPYIPVKDLLLIVISYLHDLIIKPEIPVAPYEHYLGRIQHILKNRVKIFRAYCPFMHGRKHLDFIYGIQSKPAGDTIDYQLLNNFQDRFLVILFNKVEILQTLLLVSEFRDKTVVYLMGVNNNQALTCLPEDLVKSYYRYRSGNYDIF